MMVKLIVIITAFSVCFTYISCKNSPAEDKSSLPRQADTPTIAAKDTEKSALATDSLNVNADWLLIPGISAGQTRLNENADSVYLRLGTPDGGDAAMMKAIAVWHSHHDTTNHSIAVFTSRNPDSPFARVQQIRVTSPVFKTASGIHTTSSLQDIKSYFDVTKTEVYNYAGVRYGVYDSRQGIGFEIAPDSTCTAIIIHESGIINVGTYLKFRNTGKYRQP